MHLNSIGFESFSISLSLSSTVDASRIVSSGLLLITGTITLLLLVLVAAILDSSLINFSTSDFFSKRLLSILSK